MKKTILEEKKKHSSKLIPYSYYAEYIPECFIGVQMHWHSEFEINYILTGSSEFICGNDKFIAHSGDIIILPPNMLHAIYPYGEKGQAYHTIVFSSDMLGITENDRCTVEFFQPLVNGNLDMNIHITVSHPAYEEIKKIIESIFSCVKRNSVQYDILLKSQLLYLFWFMDIQGDIYQKINAEKGRCEVVRPALEYINENFTEGITLKHLAEKVNLSKSHFMDIFKETTGVGAIEYIIQKRITFACDMLIKTKKTVVVIAYECGFRNISNFNRQFKRIVGCTPSEYRKMALKSV